MKTIDNNNEMIIPEFAAVKQAYGAEVPIRSALPLHKPLKNGFTLSELLISLAVLGVIAAFTILKVLYTSKDNQYTSIAKEAAGAFSQAYQQYQLVNGAATAATTPDDIAQYLNYVSKDTSGTLIDHVPSGSTFSDTCDATQPCYRLHNGAVILVRTLESFGGTSVNNYVYFQIDPDGVYLNTPNSKAVGFDLHFNGHIATGHERQGSDITYLNGSNSGWTSEQAPVWFSW